MPPNDTPTKALLSLKDVTLKRPDRDSQVKAILRQVSFSAASGEITAIVGPSGSGKSSLIRLINRLDDPDSGTIRLNGRDIHEFPVLELRSRIAMVTQKPFMFEGTVMENLQKPFIYRKKQPPLAESQTVLDCLALTCLPAELLERNSRSLSIGEQQRVNLARALLTEPELLLLDEPTSALDPPTTEHLAATFRNICQSGKASIILVTHDLRLAAKISDQLIYLERGEIIEEGRTAEIANDPKSLQLQRFLGKDQN